MKSYGFRLLSVFKTTSQITHKGVPHYAELAEEPMKKWYFTLNEIINDYKTVFII